jgi:hypothetical protein
MKNLRYLQVRPKSSVLDDSFSSTIEFDSFISSRDVLIPNESYMSITVAYAFAAKESLFGKTNLGAGNNITSTPWSYCESLVNDQLVSWSNDTDVVHTVYRALSESKPENSVDSSPLIFSSYALTGTASFDELTQTATQDLRALKAGFTRASAADGGVRVLTISGKVPNAFWCSDDVVYGNSRVQLRLNVNPQWFNNMLEAETVTATRTSTLPVPPDVGQPATATSVYLQVKDMALYLRVYSTEEVPRGLKPMDVMQWWSTTRVATQSEHISLNIPTSTKVVSVCFLDSRRNEDMRQSSTALTNQDTDSVVGQLQSFYINIAGQQYPSPQYNSLALGTADNAVLDARDNQRGYADFRAASSQFHLPSGGSMTFRQWELAPIFAFKLEKSPEDLQANMELHYSCRGAPTNSQILISCFYQQRVEVSYGDDGLPVSTTVSNYHD